MNENIYATLMEHREVTAAEVVHTWGVALWTPRFTRFMHDPDQRHEPEKAYWSWQVLLLVAAALTLAALAFDGLLLGAAFGLGRFLVGTAFRLGRLFIGAAFRLCGVLLGAAFRLCEHFVTTLQRVQDKGIVAGSRELGATKGGKARAESE